MKTTLVIYEPKYYVIDWDNDNWLKANQIKKRIRKDGFKTYSWTADTSELWRIIILPDFPSKIREEIANYVVKGFVKLEDPHHGGYYSLEDKKAIWHCYYALPPDHPTRDAYLAAVIKREIILCYYGSTGEDIAITLHHSGKKHSDYEKAFIKTEIKIVKDMKANNQKIIFDDWRQYLHDKYVCLYERDYRLGIFRQDDIDRRELYAYETAATLGALKNALLQNCY